MDMSDLENEISGCVGRAEWIGVIGSPSSNISLNVELLETAYDRGIVGYPCIIEFTQDGRKNYAIGQIISVELRNPHIERHPIQKIISARGEANPLTGHHDVRRVKISVGVVYSIEGNELKPSRMSSIPPTSTRVYLLNQSILDKLLKPYGDELFYLGKVYNTGDVLLPMILKHFGHGDYGLGEAYHIGIFGKTGSGKSILALMMMIGYARHKEMSIFVLDPQGQFASEFKKNEIKKALKNKLSRDVKIISLHNLVLSGYDLFKKILISSGFFKRRCEIHHEDNMSRAANQIVNLLKGRGTLDHEIKPWDAYKREAFDRIWNAIIHNEQIQKSIYTSQEPRERMISAMKSADRNDVYDEWRRIAKLFAYDGKENAVIIKNLIEDIFTDRAGKILIVDLSEVDIPEDIYWSDQIKLVILGELLTQLSKKAEERFRRGELLNTLVIVDEAHRLAPREKTDNEDLERVKSIFVDGVRTTRKYGLGWMFISQTLSSLDREIINQIRVFVFGFGLAWGIERQALREIIGGAEDAIQLYQSFKDPQSTLGGREFPFMVVGPISPLSVSGTPLFFVSLEYPSEFLKINNLKV